MLVAVARSFGIGWIKITMEKCELCFFFLYFFLFEVIGFYFVAHMMENIYVAPVVLFTPRVKQITNIAQVIKVYSTQ